MSGEWASYICNVNGKVASIFLNLALRVSAPDESRPWLLFVKVRMKHARPDGLSSPEEFDALLSIEEKLVPLVEELCGAEYAGSITSQGHREFYFYGSDPVALKNAGRQMATVFDTYKFKGGKKEDPTWRHFLLCMCPPDKTESESVPN
jgi:hypothetical protein